MKKELVEYINGTRNVVKDEFILGRERTSNSEFVIIGIPGCEEPLYTLFNSKKAKYKFKIHENTDTGDNEIAVIEKRIPKRVKKGEPTYVMLMLNEFKHINKISIDAAGLLLKLITCIEWNTSRIIRKRDKTSMTKEMMSEQFSIGKTKLKKLISELKTIGVLEYDSKKKAYFMNKALVKKGM